MTAHSALTGAELHEPKGVASASKHTVYVADGVGSGAWNLIDADNIDTTSIKNTNKFLLTVTLQDISTADVIILPVPLAATLTRITGSLSAAIATSDATVTLTNSGSAAIGTFTITHSGSAEGDTYQLTPVSNNTFTAGTYLKISGNGASTNTARFTMVFEFTMT